MRAHERLTHGTVRRHARVRVHACCARSCAGACVGVREDARKSQVLARARIGRACARKSELVVAACVGLACMPLPRCVRVLWLGSLDVRATSYSAIARWRVCVFALRVCVFVAVLVCAHVLIADEPARACESRACTVAPLSRRLGARFLCDLPRHACLRRVDQKLLLRRGLVRGAAAEARKWEAA